MATLVVTKSYTSGSAKANLIFTYTYSVSNSDAQTTLTPSSLKVTTSESGSGNDLTVAKNKRFVAVSLGLDTTVTFNGVTIVDKEIRQDSGSVSISTANRNVAKTHAAQSKTLSMTVEGTTKSATITVPAKPSYAISYNGNPNSAASGVPSAQTKWYGETLTLSSTRPTRADYTFLRWNTNSAGSGTNYSSGASYTANAKATLYAQWQRTYADPKVTINSVQRVDATSHDADDESTTVAVRFSWNLFAIPSQSNHPTSVVVTVDKGDDPDVAITLTNLTGTTGTTTTYLDADCHPDQQYVVTVALTDLGGSTRSVTAKGIVTSQYYPIDIRQGGKGVAIGGPSNEDALDVFMPLKVLKRSTSGSERPFCIHDGVVDVARIPWTGGLQLRKNGYLHLHDENEHSVPGSPPAEAHYGQSIEGYDADGLRNFYSQTAHTTADSLYRSFVVARRVSGNDITNGLYLYIAADGTKTVGLTDPAAWCSTLDSGRYTAPTALPLNSACVAYDSASTPKYAKDGHAVTVCGAVKPASEVAASETMVIGTLPAGFRPPTTVHVLCQGSGSAVWLLRLGTGGAIDASRYRNGTTNAAMTTSTWLPFSVTFMTTTL